MSVIVTVEEHTVVGGLGSAVAEFLAETDLLAGRKFRRIGFPDVFPAGYGDQAGMMRRYGISAEADRRAGEGTAAEPPPRPRASA